MTSLHGHDHGLAPGQGSTLKSRAAIASISVALLLILLKAWAALETGSMAILGSLSDSALDLLASVIVLLGVRVAAVPADKDHRFGHGKAEALAALVQIILISLAALFIAYRSVQRLIDGAQTSNAEYGIGVSAFAIVVTMALLAYQQHVVRRTRSLAIATDRLHYASDLLLNLSVIAALALDQYAGLVGADAVFGLFIAVWLGRAALQSSGRIVDQLMDREWPEDLRQRFLAAAREHPELDGLHDLRTRISGAHHFAQFHVWVPADWTVREAHDRLDRAEQELRRRFPETEILIHLDPEGHTDPETILPHDLSEARE